MRKPAVLVLIALALPGCIPEQKQQMAKCELEAQRMYPNDNKLTSSNLSRYLTVCMGATGYEFESRHTPKCAASAYMPDNPYCYIPNSNWGRLAYKTELFLEKYGL